MVSNVVTYSDGKDSVSMDAEHARQLNTLRNFMFSNVYKSQKVKKVEDLTKVEEVIGSLYHYFLNHPQKLPEDNYEQLERDGIHVVVKDYIAGMTDRYALNLYAEIILKK